MFSKVRLVNNPALTSVTVLSYLDPHLRGDDKLVHIIVIPAKAGIQVK
jgi:hypothetical protein